MKEAEILTVSRAALGEPRFDEKFIFQTRGEDTSSQKAESMLMAGEPEPGEGAIVGTSHSDFSALSRLQERGRELTGCGQPARGHRPPLCASAV